MSKKSGEERLEIQEDSLLRLYIIAIYSTKSYYAEMQGQAYFILSSALFSQTKDMH